MRDGQSLASAVLVGGGAAQDREHLIAVAASLAQALEDRHHHALGKASAVGVVGKRPAPPPRVTAPPPG